MSQQPNTKEQKKQKKQAELYALLLIDLLTKTHQHHQHTLQAPTPTPHTIQQLEDQLYDTLYQQALHTITLSNQKQNKPPTPTPQQITQLTATFTALSIRPKIKQYLTQYQAELQKLNKPINYHKPKIDPKTLHYARKKANLTHRHKSSINNLKALTDYTLLTTYNQAELHTMKQTGYTHYIGIRNTNYPCTLCDDLCNQIHPIQTQVFPAHPRCQCLIIPIQ